MHFNLGDLFEQAADTWPEREYLVANGQRRTYAEMEARANRLAHHLAAHGVAAGDHVGIYGLNSVEWVETLWAVFKLRATWVNINYRYVEEELAYLFENADVVALVYEEPFGPRVLGVRDAAPPACPRAWCGATRT
jgi:acyl-CoA synthetase (AMP-forming)/AMP-acid ligase II